MLQVQGKEPVWSDSQAQRKQQVQRVTELYEAAVAAYGSDPGLWRDYALFELRELHKGGGAVYRRAVAALEVPGAFAAEYRAALGL